MWFWQKTFCMLIMTTFSLIIIGIIHPNWTQFQRCQIWKESQICPDPRFYSFENNENSKYYKIATDNYELDILCEEYSYDFIIDQVIYQIC